MKYENKSKLYFRRALQKELTPNHANSTASAAARYTRFICVFPASTCWYSRQAAPPHTVANTRKKNPVTSSHKTCVVLRTAFAVAPSPAPAARKTRLRSFGLRA